MPFLLVVLVQSFVISESGQSSTAWIVLGLGELIRWGAYGVLIGLTYPVLHARRLQVIPGDASTDHMPVVVDSRGKRTGWTSVQLTVTGR
jgi:hypothetical protein